MPLATILCPKRGYHREVANHERQTMTVCIAAICELGHLEKRGIVLCTDWQVSSALGSAQTFLKQRHMARTWLALTAGLDSDILALIPRFRAALISAQRSTEKISDMNAPKIIRDVLDFRKREKIDEHIQGAYGISYSEFLKTAKDQFPTDIHRKAMYEVESIEIGAEFIFSGFTEDKFPILITTSGTSKTSIREDFAGNW